MNSKQRFLSAIHRQPVDHTPLFFRLWSLGGKVDHIPFDWRDQVKRCESLLNLGLDDTLLLEPPFGYPENYNADIVPGVRAHVVRFEADTIEPYPRLEKTYFTTPGEIKVKIKLSPDWPHGQDIPLFSDFNIPRFLKPLVTSPSDLPVLRRLLGEPSSAQLADFHEKAAALHAHADRLLVALDGGWTALGDAAVWLCGMQAVLIRQMDEPGFLAHILDILLDWELRQMDLLLAAGVDEFVHMAWYEGTDFWTPRNFRLLLKPRLAQLVSRAHTGGVPFRYIITKGWWPLRDDLLELGIDCICGVDPVQDRLDLRVVKNELAGRVSLMGGMNSAVTLTQWEEPRVRQAVNEAMEMFASANGFILYPVDCISTDLPWEKALWVVDEWKKQLEKGGGGIKESFG